MSDARMKLSARSVEYLPDEQLLATVSALAARERDATADLVAALAEVDRRRLYLGEGFSSLYTYCTRVLHLSEHAAYTRIEAARAAQPYPIIIEMIAEGVLTLTAVCLLAPHLTADNHRAILDAARHKTKREVEEQVAALRPLPPVPSTVRRVPGTPSAVVAVVHDVPAGPSHTTETNGAAPATPVSLSGTASERSVIVPLTPERYKVQVTICRETCEVLRRIQDLMRHVVPDGDPAVIVERALRLLLADLERRKTAHSERPHRVAPCSSGS